MEYYFDVPCGAEQSVFGRKKVIAAKNFFRKVMHGGKRIFA